MQITAKKSLDEKMFFPSSVAVIGASRKSGKVGYEVLKNILNSGFSGKVFPVNPNADEILGKRVYKNILDIPDGIDTAVITVPPEFIIGATEECGKKKVKLAVVITAGFREIGPEGAKLEIEMKNKANEQNLRILGPNCLGFINTLLPINLSFAPSFPPKGNVGIISQSGALITSAIDWSRKTGAGFSFMFSIGNGSDLDEVDLLQFLYEHRETRAVGMYIESSERGREFVELARKITAEKPVFVLRGGMSEAGVRAASSHTGSIAGSHSAWRAGLLKAGAIETNSLLDLFNACWIATSSSQPKGKKTVIITNAGGAGIVTSDLIEKETDGAMKVMELSSETVQKLKRVLPLEASPFNPIDVLGDAKSERFKDVFNILKEKGEGDILICVVTPQAMTDIEEISKVIGEFKNNLPIVAVFIGGEKMEKGKKILSGFGIPVFSFPEEAVSGINLLLRAMVEKSKFSYTYKNFRDVNQSKVRQILEKAEKSGRSHLIEPEALDVLKAYNIRTPKKIIATSADEAVKAAEIIGYPVVMKIASPDIVHKTEVGGVITGIKDEEQIKGNYSLMLSRIRKIHPEARIIGVVIEEYVEGIAEVILGLRRDPDFGPLLMFGLGGIYVEILKDVSFKLAPLSEEEVEEMFKEIKSFPILKGFRGRPRGDLLSLKEVLLRFSQLTIDVENFLEFEINPLIVREEGNGVVALDARATFERR